MLSYIKTKNSYIQNDLFRAKILGRIMIVSVVFTLLFALMHTLGINNITDIQAISNYVHAALVLPAYFLFKHKKIPFEGTAHYFLFFCFSTSTTALIYADPDTFRAIWFFLATMVSFIFLGKNFGQFYGYCSLAFILFAGFGLENNLNTQSILSIIISLIVLILVMTAYTGQMEKHLNHIENIQQELYYLANKSAISNSLASDSKAQAVQKLFCKTKELKDDLALIYIDINNINTIIKCGGVNAESEAKKLLESKLINLLSSHDILARLHQIIYIALPNKDEMALKQLLNKIERGSKEYFYESGDHTIPLKLAIAITKIDPQDDSIRSLHIRADKGLTKALASSDDHEFVFVD